MGNGVFVFCAFCLKALKPGWRCCCARYGDVRYNVNLMCASDLSGLSDKRMLLQQPCPLTSTLFPLSYCTTDMGEWRSFKAQFLSLVSY